MAFLLLPTEIKSGARNVRTLRRCAWFMYVVLVCAFIGYAATVFWLAYRSRNVPAVSFDYKVELTQLPNIYICPYAFFSSYATTLPITSMTGSCNRYFPKQVPGPGATGLTTGLTRGSVNWALGNSRRDASKTFEYKGDTDSDYEVEGVELPSPDFSHEGQNNTVLGSSLCLRYNTSRFSFTPELIASTFQGVFMSFYWTLPPVAPLNGYTRGANVLAAFSDDGVRRGEYDFPGSIISGGGNDQVELSLTVRTYLNGSEKVSGSIATTHQDYVTSFNSTYGIDFPASDYFYAALTLNPQGRLHITEKSPINWTIILSQIVAGWSLVTAIFGMFFAYDLRREWALPWPAHFKEIVTSDEELKGGSLETIPMRRMSHVPNLYPTTSSHV
ncbi:hypothetical protein KFL_006660060 [Klebsormidium nitens]|uniref:Transmembrane protein n=1 Tax=Klebsormidium nitens TaxID=105231 RepID=A0A1Y1IKH8_KLENI|nr:hypothetical protein KFL_006660060 [Klebsormidium nitens]|eukprot:GAQ90642.1 hypothetical protein KFL_006660060 [Klebsormidium nitens]